MIIDSLKPLIVQIEFLKPDPNNARLHPEENRQAIRRSLETFGQRKPVVARKDGTVEAGNGILQEARELGWTELAAVIVDDDDNTAMAYALMDNQSALLAKWDDDILKCQLEGLKDNGFDLNLTGFSLDDLNELKQDDVTEGLIDDDEIPDAAESVTKPGDLWILGEHRLLCGDCTNKQDIDLLMNGAMADMVFTDPPYNVNWQYRGKVHGERFHGIINDNLSPEDWDKFCGDFIMCLSENLKPGRSYYVCSGWNSFAAFERELKNWKMEFRQLIIWAILDSSRTPV